MNLVGCDGAWVFYPASEGVQSLACSGSLVTVTPADIAAETSLSAEDRQLLYDATMGLFVVVFGFLVLKKVLP